MRVLLLASALLLGACAATPLVPGAERVIVSPNPPPKSCRFKGMVIGEQGGSFTGGFTSNKRLAEGAMNDMRNKALEIGANYVQLQTTRAGQTGSGSLTHSSSQQTDVTNTGNAYQCPPKAIGL